MIQLKFGILVQSPFQVAEVPHGTISTRFPVEYLVLAQCPHDGLVQQEFNVLGMVQDLDLSRTLLCSPPILRLTRIDAFDDAQSPEVVQRQLEPLQRLPPGNEMRRLSLIILWEEIR